jgi:hypothetical protein
MVGQRVSNPKTEKMVRQADRPNYRQTELNALTAYRQTNRQRGRQAYRYRRSQVGRTDRLTD